MFRVLMSIWIVFCSQMANAELSIEISGAGEHQTPVSVVRFAGEEGGTQSISEIISNDLLRTGLFKLIHPAGRAPHVMSEVKYVDWYGVEAIVMGSITLQEGGNMLVTFSLLDMVRRSELLKLTVSAPQDQGRAIAHGIADRVFERLTGTPGVFSTRIAYVNRDKGHYRLVVADSDGYGEQDLLNSREPIMSPAWSPDGAKIAYVSFEERRAIVYVQSLSTRERRVVADFPGSNSAPAWSPDGKKLAVVLTRDDTSQIYVMNADGTGLKRITFSDAIDTEPTFSVDGKFLLFASDRGGTVQIYRVAAEGGAATRMTYETGNSFSPRFSPDGKSFAYTLFNGGKFYIVVNDLGTQQVQYLSNGGWDKKPSFAPNGKLILFATEVQGRGILASVSSDGRVKQKLAAQRGDIREPVWGPLLKR
ncbi:MAG: Tol-Pal system protein TolB [Sideroxydans sp.]|nr:Tol-Pal system protein TolB [Sideroxydans sp.]NOT98721.1 Tol-Pal system protein TolB [Sideroxydans sp.]